MDVGEARGEKFSSVALCTQLLGAQVSSPNALMDPWLWTEGGEAAYADMTGMSRMMSSMK